MILSMTGFGKAVKVYNNKKITAEIKSLNSKQIDFAVRLPQNYREIELELRSSVTQALMRGKIDLFVSSEPIEGAATGNLNVPLLQAYKTQLEAAAEQLGIDPPQDWYTVLLRMPDAMKSDARSTEADEQELQVVKDVVSEAVEQLLAFRKQEGARLETFFEEKIDAIQQLFNEVPAI